MALALGAGHAGSGFAAPFDRDRVERFSLALEAINEGVYDWNVASGAIGHMPMVDADFALQATVPTTPAAWFEMVHPDDREAYSQAVRRHLKGETYRLRCEYRYRSREGEWRWARQHGVAVRGADGRATRVVGAVGDITSQREREAELERARAEAAAAHAAAARANEVMHTVLENMSDGVMLFDQDFNWLMANRRLMAFQDFPADVAYPGASGYDVLRFQARRGDFGPVEDVEAAAQERAAVMRAPGGSSYVRRTAGGQFIEFNFKPLPDGRLLAVYRDLTRLKDSEDALATAERRLRDAIENQAGGFCLYGPDMRLVTCNAAFADLVPNVPEWSTPGLDLETILRAVAERGGLHGLTPQNRDDYVARWLRYMRAPDRPVELRTGKTRWVLLEGRKTPDGCTVVLFNDLSELKQRERELAATQKQLSQAIENQSGGFALFGTDLSLILFNAAYSAIAPQVPEWSTPGVSLVAMLTAVAKSGVFPGLEDVTPEQYVEYWLGYMARPDRPIQLHLGGDRWLQVEGRKTPDGDTVVLFNDLTKLKQRERELADAKQRLTQAIENLVDGFAYFDKDERLVICNEAYRRFAHHAPKAITPGFTLEEGLRDRFDHGPPTERELDVERYVRGYLRTHRSLDASVEVPLARGRWARIRNRRTPEGGVVTVVADISELKAHATELAAAQERLTQAIENLSDGFAYFDKEERLVICNEAYRRFMHYTPAAITPGVPLETGLRERFVAGPAPETQIEVERYIQGFLRAHRSGTADIEVPLAQGRYVRIRNRNTPEGGVAVVVADISELKARAVELERARDVAETDRAEAQAANQAKSTFLATMSHEIRTPMNGVLGMMDVLERQGLDDLQRRTVATMRVSAQSLLRIIDDILDFSKIEAGRLELEETAFSLSGLIESVVATFSTQAKARKLRLATVIHPQSHDALVGDPTRVRQILFNLLGNALKFTERGGVRVEASATALGGGRARVTLIVKDTGIGMDTDQLARLFTPFSQGDSSTTRKFGGSGLGLSIVRRLAQLMDGDVTVTSRPGVGSVFEVSLSLVAAPADSPLHGVLRRPAAEPSLAQAGAAARVLVVDDHPINRDVLVMQLGLFGLQADTAEDGVEALELWAPGRYAVVLADIHMPRMDGYQFARELRAREPRGVRTPIVAVTANALKGEEARCLDAGMDGYLPKPVGIDRLRSTLERWLSVGGEAAAASAAAAAEAPPLDREVLVAWLGDDEEAIASLLRKFRKTAVESEREIERAFKAGDLAALAAAAHKLKGAAHTVGAGPLGTAGGELERAAKAGDRLQCREGLGALASALRQLLAELPGE